MRVPRIVGALRGGGWGVVLEVAVVVAFVVLAIAVAAAALWLVEA